MPGARHDPARQERASTRGRFPDRLGDTFQLTNASASLLGMERGRLCARYPAGPGAEEMTGPLPCGVAVSLLWQLSPPPRGLPGQRQAATASLLSGTADFPSVPSASRPRVQDTMLSTDAALSTSGGAGQTEAQQRIFPGPSATLSVVVRLNERFAEGGCWEVPTAQARGAGVQHPWPPAGPQLAFGPDTSLVGSPAHLEAARCRWDLCRLW